MEEIDVSIVKDNQEDDQVEKEKRLKAVREEFLGGDDDDLKRLGFFDSDEEIDFTNFELAKKAES